MAQAQDLINAAGRLIGELRGDRVFGATELTQLLVSMNQMLDGFSQGRAAIFSVAQDSLTLAGAASYTMGSSGDLNTTRPVQIVAAHTLASSGIRKAAKIVTADEFATIKDNTVTGDFIDMLFPDYGFTLITLRFWPKPSSGSLVLNSLKPLTAFSLLTTTVSFPPGYEEALVYNFAAKIAPEFGRAVPQEVLAVADSSRKAIAATNAQLIAPSAQGA